MEKIKQLVSQDLKRFQDGNFDLDLTYITPSLVAMGFPAQGVEGYFRNNILDIARYLNERHKNHFMVFNLSAERNYDPELMHRRVIQIGFPDHHAPPLTLLFKILLKVHSYLSEDDENVACIHCLAGRGRTGCVIINLAMLPTVMEAFDFYAQRRSNKLQGVSQPSQRRYCTYIDEIVRLKNEDITIFNPRPRALMLTRIRFGPVPSISSQGGLRPLIYMYNYTNAGEDVLHVTETERDKAKHFIGGAKTVILDVTEKTSRPVLLCGDIVFKMSHISTLLGVTKYEELVRLIFHTGMEVHKQQPIVNSLTADQRAKMKLGPEEDVLIFGKPDFDTAYKDNRFAENFRIEFIYKLLPDVPEPYSSNPNLWDESLYQNFIVTNRSIELDKKLDFEKKAAQSKLGMSSSSLSESPNSSTTQPQLPLSSSGSRIPNHRGSSSPQRLSTSINTDYLNDPTQHTSSATSGSQSSNHSSVNNPHTSERSISQGWVSVGTSPSGSSRQRSTAFAVNMGSAGRTPDTADAAPPKDPPISPPAPNIHPNPQDPIQISSPSPSSRPAEEIVSPRTAKVRETKPIDPLEMMRY